MDTLEKAKLDAIERIRRTDDKSQNGLIIWKTANEYGLDCSVLARAIARKHKEEGKRVSQKLVWLDMSKVKSLGCGGDLGKLARFCDLGHDTLRIADGRDGKGVRWGTVLKIAEAFHVDADGLLHDENKQMSIEEPRAVEPDRLTEDEAKLIRVMAIWNGITEEEVKTRIIKRFLLEADTMIAVL